MTAISARSYVEGIELFDHKYFQIPLNEAADPDCLVVMPKQRFMALVSPKKQVVNEHVDG